MGVRMHDAGGLAARTAPAPVSRSTPALTGRIDARWVSEVGRAVTIWLPVFLLTADRLSSPAAILLTSSVAAAVWFFTLRSAFRAVPFILGPAVPASVGTLTGLVVISALAFWIPLSETRLPFSTLALMAISVFALSTLWEAVWRRQFAAKRRVLVVGTTSWAEDVAGVAAHAVDVPFRVVGIVDDEPVPRSRRRRAGPGQRRRPLRHRRGPTAGLDRPRRGQRLRETARIPARRRVERLQGRRRLALLRARVRLGSSPAPDVRLVHEHPAPPPEDVQPLCETDARRRRCLPRHAARRSDRALHRPARAAEPGPGHLSPDARRGGRQALHDVQVPHDGGGRRGARLSRLR